MNKDFLPPKEALRKMLGQDFFLWEYYGEGPLGKIQAWIFRSRMRVVIEFLTRAKLYPRRILDVGCGPMFISYALLNNVGEYVGIDIMPGISLKKYSDAMNNIGVRSLHIVRASAEHLPFRNGSFDLALSLDVLEHLTRPRQAIMEIFRVLKNNGLAVISLPLENLTQKLLRIGFIIMKITGDPILKKARQVPITQTPEYHYVGDIKSYDEMIKKLRECFIFIYTEYTPVGLHRSINVNAIHVTQKKPLM